MASIARIDEPGSPRRSARPRRFAVVGACAVVILCAALAAPVSAFVATVTHGVVVRKGASGSVSATCPKGEHVSFGGLIGQFRPPPNVPNLPAVFPEGMVRTAPDRWTVTGQSATTGVGSRLTAIAFCDTGAVPTTASKTVALPAKRAGTATAACPPGTVVVGGGFKSGAAPNHMELIVSLARGSSRQWRVALRNISSFPTTLTALAYCAAGVAPTLTATTVPLTRNKGGTARATCPTGTTLVFGGVVANSPGRGAGAADLEAFSFTAASATQWVVTGYNAGNSTGSLEALAYCR